jgi:hypothetical protein
MVGRIVEHWKGLRRDFVRRVSEDWRAERVGAHALLTMLALAVEHRLRRAWEPLLGAEVPSAWEKRGTPISEPAPPEHPTPERSHTLRTLLADLSTITRNRILLLAPPPPAEGSNSDPAAPLEKLTAPTSLQRRAFELLGVAPFAPAPAPSDDPS